MGAELGRRNHGGGGDGSPAALEPVPWSACRQTRRGGTLMPHHRAKRRPAATSNEASRAQILRDHLPGGVVGRSRGRHLRWVGREGGGRGVDAPKNTIE